MFEVKQNDARGYSVKFANGNTLSVKWSDFHYCDIRWDKMPDKDKPLVSKNCEVRAIDEYGRPHWFDNDTIEGWVTPERLVEIMAFVSSNKLRTDKPNWDDMSEDDEDG